MYPSAIHFLSLLLHREQSGSCPRVLWCSPPMCPHIYTQSPLYHTYSRKSTLPNISASIIQAIHLVLPHGHDTTAELLNTCGVCAVFSSKMSSQLCPESFFIMSTAGTLPYLNSQHPPSTSCYCMGILTRLISLASMMNSCKNKVYLAPLSSSVPLYLYSESISCL